MQNNEMTSNNIIKNRETLFLASFILVIISKCLNISVISEYIPYSTVYALYIAVWCFLAILNIRITKHLMFSTKVMFGLGLYYVIWGFHNINEIDYSDAYGNLIRSVLLVLFIIVSCYWINEYNCLDKLVKVVYYSFSIYLIVWLLISIPDINLAKTLSNFWSSSNDVRYRNYIGFSFPNIGAEMAVSTIMLSKMTQCNNAWKRMINVLMLFIVVINNSRGSLLALVLFEILYYFVRNKNTKSVKRLWRAIVAISFVVICYIVYLMSAKNMSLYEVLDGTNRQAAIEENMRLLKNSGKWWMGIGRLTGGFFSAKNTVYGARTGYLEVFYFEAFITTGIIGCIWIALLLITYIKKVVNIAQEKSNNTYGKWLFCVVIYMLFVSLFEVYFFSYIYATSMCFNIIILSYINGLQKQKNENKSEWNGD